LAVVVFASAVMLMSLTFLMIGRVRNPLLPRVMYGFLAAVLWFPSGAVYPKESYPDWLRALSVVDPFTYAVHALRSLLLRNTGFDAIGADLLYIVITAIVALALARVLFRREL